MGINNEKETNKPVIERLPNLNAKKINIVARVKHAPKEKAYGKTLASTDGVKPLLSIKNLTTKNKKVTATLTNEKKKGVFFLNSFLRKFEKVLQSIAKKRKI